MIGVIGLGFVGSAALKSFSSKGVDVVGYDKYNNKSTCNLDDILKTNLCFLCLPTLFDENTLEYDKTAIYEVCSFLYTNHYTGLVVIKSTVEPETCKKLSKKFTSLTIVHNPEFLSAKTSYEDFHNQSHIILGSTLR